MNPENTILVVYQCVFIYYEHNSKTNNSTNVKFCILDLYRTEMIYLVFLWISYKSCAHKGPQMNSNALIYGQNLLLDHFIAYRIY